MKTETVSLTDAARKLGVSRAAITNAVRRGRLRPVWGGIDGERLTGVYAHEVEALAKHKAAKLGKGGAA